MRLTLLLLLAATLNCLAQNDALDAKNGFKDIRLLSNVTEYSGLSYSKALKDKPQHALYKAAKGHYQSIGDVPIRNLQVYTYRNLIYRIEVLVTKDEKLFRSLEKAFGKIKYSMGSQVSYWEGAKVRLTYRPEGKKNVLLTYVAKDINKIIAEDKKKAIDSLTSEF